MKVQETSHETIRSIAKAYVRRENPLTLSEIARRLNTSRDTISRVLHRGIEEGILDRPTALCITTMFIRHAVRGNV